MYPEEELSDEIYFLKQTSLAVQGLHHGTQTTRVWQARRVRSIQKLWYGSRERGSILFISVFSTNFNRWSVLQPSFSLLPLLPGVHPELLFLGPLLAGEEDSGGDAAMIHDFSSTSYMWPLTGQMGFLTGTRLVL